MFVVQPSMSLRSLRLGFQFSPSSLFLHSNSIGLRSFSCKMSADSSIPIQSISLPCQIHHPVQILAAPGVSDSDFRNAVDSSLFKQWLMNLQSESGILANGTMSLKQVLIQGVDMFGSRVGFLKFEADIYDKQTGKKSVDPVGSSSDEEDCLMMKLGGIRTNTDEFRRMAGVYGEGYDSVVIHLGIVFARGPAVAVLILLNCEGETYAVLTEQVRVPVGKLMLELPAGMLDDDKGDFVGTAVREVEEEIGIQLKLEDMVDLTGFLDPSTGCRVFPSPGGCDEGIGLFLYRGSASKETIAELQGKETGLRDHGELIKVHVVPYETLWRVTADSKALMAIALYEMAQKEGLLPSFKP